MAYSYDDQLPELKDHLRFLTGDNDQENHFLEDGEIDFIASEEANINKAAAKLCRIIATKLLREAGFKDSFSLIYDPTKKAKEFRELAKDFDSKAQSDSSNMTGIVSSGIKSGSSADPAFTRDLHFSKNN